MLVWAYSGIRLICTQLMLFCAASTCCSAAAALSSDSLLPTAAALIHKLQYCAHVLQPYYICVLAVCICVLYAMWPFDGQNSVSIIRSEFVRPVFMSRIAVDVELDDDESLEHC